MKPNIQKQQLLSITRLKSLILYEEESGMFFWKYGKTSQTAKAKVLSDGRVIAGHVRPNGYSRIIINQREYLSHRLAWFYVTGSWPENQIDHINGIKSDNRFLNLRQASHSQNQRNTGLRKRTKGRSKFKGVFYIERLNKFRATISVNGKSRCLGFFLNEEDAAKAYNRIAKKLYGDFANLNPINKISKRTSYASRNS